MSLIRTTTRVESCSPDVPLPTRELVSTFGHGPHTCPAARFSISAIRTSIRLLLQEYDFTPAFRSATPRHRQIGGVARAARPCRVAYQSRLMLCPACR